MNLTDGAVGKLKLKPPNKGSIVKWDDEVPGFGVRITSNGVTSFVLAYRLNGRQSKYTIGRTDDWGVKAARKKARKLRTGIDDGVDPQEERANLRGELTVAKLAGEFMEKHATVNLRPGTVRGYREMLRDHVLPEIGRLGVNAVNERDVLSIKAAMKDSPYRANRTIALISSMFNRGVGWKLCQHNPAEGVEFYPEDEREFWLTEEQYTALDAAIGFYGRECGDAIRLLILTGAREMEVLAAPWTQFDLEHAFWTRPAHTTKEKKTERITINNAAVAVLRRMKKAATSPYLFPGKPGKDGKSTHRKTIRKPWIQICKAAGLAEEYEVQGKRRMLKRWRPIMRLHDLRHSYASWLVSDGVSLKRVGKLLGQSQETTTARYAHLADKSVRDATNRFGDMITRLVQ
ncbi:MAG: site-specific integrase [Candidatus Sulfotelmatobacter sp.]